MDAEAIEALIQLANLCRYEALITTDAWLARECDQAANRVMERMKAEAER